MKILGNFLARFATLAPPERIIVEAVQAVIAEDFRITLSKEHIRIVKDSVTLSVPSVVRQEISKNKKAILERINKKIGSERIFELR